MNKPILATNIDGFLIKHEAFILPHKAWFKRAIQLTGDTNLEKWIKRKDYFQGVDLAMAQIMPQATEQQRTLQARHWYQEDVVQYIANHPKAVYIQVVEKLRKLKSRFRLALVTTNTKEYIHQILKTAKLQGLYDIVFAISATEKPDKAELFKRFAQEHGNPKYYIAARSKEAFEECLKLGSLCIYAAWDEFDKETASLATQTIRKPSELEIKLFR